jgi:predicted dehydrogenase
VDVVADLMIHDIDIILALVAGNLTDVRAVGTPVLTEHVDIANARLEFADGAVANIVASRVSEQTVRRIRVFQAGGYLSLDFVGQTLDIARPAPPHEPLSHRRRVSERRPRRDPVAQSIGLCNHEGAPAQPACAAPWLAGRRPDPAGACETTQQPAIADGAFAPALSGRTCPDGC